MTPPLDLQLRGLAPSPALETAVREKLARLCHACPDLLSCRVTVESRPHHPRHGQAFAVRVDARYPGHEVAIDHVEDPDVHVALRDAFDALGRRLDDARRRARVIERSHGHEPV